MLAKARGKLSSPAAVRFDEGSPELQAPAYTSPMSRPHLAHISPISPELQAQAAALGRCAAQPAYRVGFEAFFGAGRYREI